MLKSNSNIGTLLFHYHEKVYQDEQGNLWMSSGQGIWLDEIAQNFEKLYIFNFQTLTKTKKHDYILEGKNIEWISLGTNQGYVDFFRKRRRIHRLCKKWSQEVDYLLIRGFTPFQNKIWKHIKPRISKSYILVRSLKQPRPLDLKNPLTLLAYLFNKLQEFRFRKIIKSADNLFTNSIEVQDELLQLSGRKAIFSTTNVLKARDFQDFDFKPWSNEFHLLFVGRISTSKGCTELAKSFCEVQLQNPELKITLHMAGDGHLSYVNQLKELIHQEGLLDQVEFYGRLSFGKDLFSLYKKANALVLPSYTEGFPRVVWEAALFAIPIVVSRVGGIPFIIKHEEHALVVAPKNIVALSSALSSLLRNKDESLRRARNAYDLALSYTLEYGVGNLIAKIKNNIE
jgi:glycosyltransferase involved in cell wall biosynthesis